MLTLVEPFIKDNLLDRPRLGCAMLISACQEKGIKTNLVKGQTRYLKDIFINDSEELWGLIQDLKEDDLKKIGIAEYKKSIQEKGIRQFQDELKSLYQYVIVDKNPRHYFNAQMVEKFNNLYRIFVAIYSYYLRELNHSKLKIVDRYVSEIIKSSPRYIGFSLQGSFEPLSRTIRKRIKELTEIPIIVGGSLTPFIDLKELDKIFEEEYFDYLVIGAGEHALPALIEAMDNKKEPKGITNVFYKEDSKIKGNDLEVIDDLDSLPYPDYSQFDLDLYLTPKRILPLQTVRGCSWGKCAFCSYSNTYLGSYKTFSVEKVIKTIRYLQNTYDCSHFVFHDDELPPARAKKISEAILSNNLKGISIFTIARLTNGYNSNELLGQLRRAGFSTFAWGMESGCQRVLDLMNKGTKISTMSQVLRKSSKNNITNLCFIFFGSPSETKKEAQQTIKFLQNHANYIEDIMFDLFNFDRYSPIGKNPEKWGVDIKKDGSYSTKSGMSREEVDAFFSKFVREFKINSIKITSDKLKYLLPWHNRGMLHFLNSSYGLLSNPSLLECLKKKKLNSVFPMILGEIKKVGRKNVFFPININETSYINRYFPEKEKVLDNLEERVFNLCDGTSSIEDIILTIYRNSKGKYRKQYIHKKCIDFLYDIFSKKWGIAFTKSWAHPIKVIKHKKQHLIL